MPGSPLGAVAPAYSYADRRISAFPLALRTEERGYT